MFTIFSNTDAQIWANTSCHHIGYLIIWSNRVIKRVTLKNFVLRGNCSQMKSSAVIVLVLAAFLAQVCLAHLSQYLQSVFLTKHNSHLRAPFLSHCLNLLLMLRAIF